MSNRLRLVHAVPEEPAAAPQFSDLTGGKPQAQQLANPIGFNFTKAHAELQVVNAEKAAQASIVLGGRQLLSSMETQKWKRDLAYAGIALAGAFGGGFILWRFFNRRSP